LDGQNHPRTISELAARLGVSSMTIHRAIAGKPDISEKTRTRVLAEIERLGWRPNIAARGLRQGKTFSLGILVSNVAVSFLPEILQGVNQKAEERGCHTFVSVHENDFARAEQHLHALHSKGVDGIVYYPTAHPGEAALLNRINRSTPVVTIMRQVEGFEGTSVLVDDRRGGRLAVEHLLRLEHREIGFLGYGENPFSRLRHDGFEEALRLAGLAPRPEWTAADQVPGDERAVDAAEQILGRPDRPTALFCASDRLAARAFQAAGRLGLRVPEDVSIVGFNGDPWGALLSPPLTTIAQPRGEVGAAAADALLARPENGANGANGHHSLDGRPSDHPNTALRIISPWLVTRLSTRSLRVAR
jgi:DNA-binding LacI/PurR family transcriptional regulator